MTKNRNDRHRLSAEGTLRQKRMLAELKTELLRKTGQRRRRKTLIALGVAAILVAAGAWTSNWSTDSTNLTFEKTTQRTVKNVESSAPQFSHVTLEKISDDELLAALANLGHPSVLGQIGGEATVVSQVKP